jgi:hypothetical protein
LNTYRRLPKALTALQAAESAPAIAKLGRLIQESTERFHAALPLLPPALKSAIKSGPIDEQGWCLLVSSPAVAAKLRQLIPAINRHLALQHYKPLPIRLKVMVSKR